MPFAFAGTALVAFAAGWMLAQWARAQLASNGVKPAVQGAAALPEAPEGALNHLPAQTPAPHLAVIEAAAAGSVGSAPPWPAQMAGILYQPPAPYVE